MEVGDELHRPSPDCVEYVSPKERVADMFDGVKLELVGEMATDGIGGGRVVCRLADAID